MFVMTLQKGRLKKIGVALACGAAVLAVAIGVNSVLSNSEESTLEVAAIANIEMSSAQDLVTFLQGYGVETDVATATVSAVTVPQKWDESFEAFNEVIKESSLTLEKHKGKQVDKWSLLIPSQSTEESKMYAVVLVHENKAVAAYLLEKPSGEVLPLSHAAQTSLPLTDEEISATNNFGEDAEVIVVTDGEEQQAVPTDGTPIPQTAETPETPVQANPELTTTPQAATETPAQAVPDVVAEQAPVQDVAAPVTPFYDESTMPID